MKNIKKSARSKILKAIKEGDCEGLVFLGEKYIKDQNDIYEICKKIMNTYKRGNKEKREKALNLITSLEKSVDIDYFAIVKEDSYMNIFKHAVRLDLEELMIHIINSTDDVKIFENMKVDVSQAKNDEELYNMIIMRASEDFFFTLIEQKNVNALEALLNKGYRKDNPYVQAPKVKYTTPLLSNLIDMPDLINKFDKTEYMVSLKQAEQYEVINGILKSKNNLDYYDILKERQASIIDNPDFCNSIWEHLECSELPKRIKKGGFYHDFFTTSNLTNLTLQPYIYAIFKNKTIDEKLMIMIFDKNPYLKNIKDINLFIALNANEKVDTLLSLLDKSVFLLRKNIQVLGLPTVHSTTRKVLDNFTNRTSSMSSVSKDVERLEKLLYLSVTENEKNIIKNSLNENCSENQLRKRL